MKYSKMAMLVTGLFLLLGMTAFAGSINDDEQRVLDVAKAPVEYNGKQYISTDTSIKRLTAYLNQDDVNLSAAQANKAITKFYENISIGIEDGYMKEIVSDKPAKEDEKPTTQQREDKEQADTPDSEDISTKKEEKPKSEGESTAPSTETAKESAGADALIAEILENNSLPPEETTVTEKEETGDRQETTEENEKKGFDFSKAGEFNKGMNILVIAGVIVILVAVGCIITIYVNKRKYK